MFSLTNSSRTKREKKRERREEEETRGVVFVTHELSDDFENVFDFYQCSRFLLLDFFFLFVFFFVFFFFRF
jgi:hypothetical protein